MNPARENNPRPTQRNLVGGCSSPPKLRFVCHRRNIRTHDDIEFALLQVFNRFGMSFDTMVRARTLYHLLTFHLNVIDQHCFRTRESRNGQITISYAGLDVTDNLPDDSRRMLITDDMYRQPNLVTKLSNNVIRLA